MTDMPTTGPVPIGAPAVEVSGVDKTFATKGGTVTALQDIDLTVAPGEFVSLIGPSGCGKSTLLKILAGIYRQDRGEVLLDGVLSPFIELGVGFNPDLAARDNVVMNGIMLGLSPREARERFDAVVEFAELEEFVDLKLKNYSSGMHVRLAFSVMIQVGYFKLTKKRVFLMAPIHHHFEKLGWAEPTIVIRFWIVAALLALVGLATLKLR